MRVIAGIRKGKKLIGPKDLKFRPTTGSTKKFIFDYLGESIVNERILDLFSGTGNLGIEALSRGADSVTFVEKSKLIFQILHRNIKLTQFEHQSQIIITDVFRYIKYLSKKKEKFGFIFADPPYRNGVYPFLIKEIDQNKLLQVDGVFVLEHQSDKLGDLNLSALELLKTKIAGNTSVSFFINKGG